VNKAIEKLVEQGFSTLSTYLKKRVNGGAVIVYPDSQGNTVKFLFTNWMRAKTDENKISETFDWNTAIIGFSSKGTSTTPIYDMPKSYDSFKVICYGMGRKGTTWKGSRIVLSSD